MRQELVRGYSIFVIHDFLTPEECEEFIAETERQGYGDAPITTMHGPVMRKDIRNNERVMVDDPGLAARLYERAAPLLPAEMGEWHLKGFNERFRYYRYDPGQTFRPHYDGAFYRSNGEQSLLTFMVYLNDGYEGGTTEFYHGNGQAMVTIEPRAGMALVFVHAQCHEGAEVRSGRKYVLRTDVMYSRWPKLARKPSPAGPEGA